MEWLHKTFNTNDSRHDIWLYKIFDIDKSIIDMTAQDLNTDDSVLDMTIQDLEYQNTNEIRHDIWLSKNFYINKVMLDMTAQDHQYQLQRTYSIRLYKTSNTNVSIFDTTIQDP